MRSYDRRIAGLGFLRVSLRGAIGASLGAVSGLLIGADNAAGAPSLSPRPSGGPSGRVETSDTWLASYRGPLVEDGFTASDVLQGNVGDCGFASAVAACAAIDPDILANAIRDNGDGTVFVRLYKKRGRRFIPHQVLVRRKLETNLAGPVHGRSPVNGDPVQQMELWWPMFEKAYLRHIGGAKKLTFGQLPTTPISALLGKNTTLITTALHSPERLYHHMKASLDRHRPIVAATLIKPFFVRSSGLRPFHNYTVVRVFADAKGRKSVELRDPFGSTAAKGSRGDGVFVLPFTEFAKHFAAFAVVKEH